MNDETTLKERPGIVLFAAVLNFLSALMWLGATALVVLIFLLGMTAQLSQTASQYVPQAWTAPAASSNAMLAVVGVFVVILMLTSSVSFLMIGIGLLRASKLSWYFQVILSVLGLFAVPIGTVLNALILVFFFQRKTRDFFGIR